MAEALPTAVSIGAGTEPHTTVLLRGDSAFYTGTVVSAARRKGARFSITVPSNSAVRRAIAGIVEDEWIPIRYPNAVWDDEGQCWISDAEVAETSYTAFAGTKHQITARLVVRRVRRQPPPGQDELLPVFRHHAFFTDTTLDTVEADLTHRAHAIVEQVFADLIDGPLAHMPSGRFASNGAWLSCAAMAHNLLCAATLTSRAHGKARAATVRRQIIHVAAHVTRHAHGVRLSLPSRWPWAGYWRRLFEETHRPLLA